MAAPLLIFGLGVALPRYIAFAGPSDAGRTVPKYFGAGLSAVAITSLSCALVAALFPDTMAFLFFGSREYAELVLPISLVLVGLTLHSVVYAYFRGRLAMRPANCLQLLNVAFVPVIAFLSFGDSVRDVLAATGAMMILVAGTAALFTPLREAARTTSKEARELLAYGVQRVPGEFIQGALLGFPAIFVAHVHGVREAGLVAFGTSMVTVIASLFAPIGLILLPKASRMLGSGDTRRLSAHARKLLLLTAFGSTLVAALVWISAEPLTRFYLGPDFGAAVPVLRLVVLGAVPFSLYFVLRGLVDAIYLRAMNTVNLAAASGLFVLALAVTYGVGASTQGVLLSLVAALLCLALLSFRSASKVLSHGAERSKYLRRVP
jgi:O-antigen/teichoic acid export membrane protein